MTEEIEANKHTLKEDEIIRWESCDYINDLLFRFFYHREQELLNLLHDKDYVRAVGVALSLEQPFRVLTILKGTININY